MLVFAGYDARFQSDRLLVFTGIRREPRECRIYTWNEPWLVVTEAARRDLPKFKLIEHRRKKKGGPDAKWMSRETYGNGLEGLSADVVLNIVPGRTHQMRKDGPDIDNDPAWVTVSVITTLEDNWINILRYTFFSQSY